MGLLALIMIEGMCLNQRSPGSRYSALGLVLWVFGAGMGALFRGVMDFGP